MKPQESPRINKKSIRGDSLDSWPVWNRGTFMLSKCSLPDCLLSFAVTTKREHWSKKSEKRSPFLSVVCTQIRSLAFFILRVNPENPFFLVNEYVLEYQIFGF